MRHRTWRPNPPQVGDVLPSEAAHRRQHGTGPAHAGSPHGGGRRGDGAIGMIRCDDPVGVPCVNGPLSASASQPPALGGLVFYTEAQGWLTVNDARNSLCRQGTTASLLNSDKSSICQNPAADIGTQFQHRHVRERMTVFLALDPPRQSK